MKNEFGKFLREIRQSQLLSPAIRTIGALARQEGLLLLGIVLLGVLVIAFRTVAPQVARVMVDAVEQQEPLARIVGIFAIWTSIHVLQSATGYLRKRVDLGYRRIAVHRIRCHLLSRYLHASSWRLDKESTGNVASRVLEDSDNLDGVLPPDFADALLNFIEFVAILAILAATNWVIAALAAVNFMFGVLTRTIVPLRKVYRAHNVEKARALSHVTEVLHSRHLIKSSATERREMTLASRVFDRYGFARFIRDLLKERQVSVSMLVDGLATPLLILSGSILATTGLISISALMTVLLYQPKVAGAFSRLLMFLPRYNTGRVYAEAVADSLAKETESNSDGFFPRLGTGAIAFRNVSFGYGEDPVVSNLSFSIEPGTVTALVGPSGGGKSTVLRLILRLRNPTAGTITHADTPITDYQITEWRRTIGYVQQDAIVLNRSLKENVAYKRQDGEAIDENRVWESLRLSNAAEFVRRLPQGLSTIVGERGVRLSGGERQRLCIARELYTNPTFLVLDEATSSLDTESERAVQRALDAAMLGRSVLVAAHRLSTIRNADQILVLSAGQIVERGSHRELMMRNGVYCRLVSADDRH